MARDLGGTKVRVRRTALIGTERVEDMKISANNGTGYFYPSLMYLREVGGFWPRPMSG